MLCQHVVRARRQAPVLGLHTHECPTYMHRQRTSIMRAGSMPAVPRRLRAKSSATRSNISMLYRLDWDMVPLQASCVTVHNNALVGFKGSSGCELLRGLAAQRLMTGRKRKALAVAVAIIQHLCDSR